MSNTVKPRPNLARKVTRKTVEKADADLSRGCRITIGEDDYEVRVGDVTPAAARELRRLTGYSFMHLLDAMSTDPDIDLIQSFMWLARTLRGDTVDGRPVGLDDVDVSYADMLADDFDMAEAGPEVVDPGPET